VKVYELVEILKGFDPDLEVFSRADSGCCGCCSGGEVDYGPVRTAVPLPDHLWDGRRWNPVMTIRLDVE
jgi:hypothetical protein